MFYSMKNVSGNNGITQLISTLMLIAISLVLVAQTMQLTNEQGAEISISTELLVIYISVSIGLVITSALLIYSSIVVVSGLRKRVPTVKRRLRSITGSSTDTITEQDAIRLLYSNDEIDINEFESSIERLLEQESPEFSYQEYEDLPDRNPDHKIARVEEQDDYYYWSKEEDNSWSKCQSLSNSDN